jgi:hypothetical protein
MGSQEMNMTDERLRHEPDQKQTRMAWLLLVIRYGLPAAGVIAGVVVMSLGSESDLEGGAGIVGAGLAIYAINWLYRAAFEGDRVEREKEQAARAYLAKHGHWPDEAPRSRGRGGKLNRPS